MLTSAETIEVVAKQIVKHKVPALVVDPVRRPILMLPTPSGLPSPGKTLASRPR